MEGELSGEAKDSGLLRALPPPLFSFSDCRGDENNSTLVGLMWGLCAGDWAAEALLC